MQAGSLVGFGVVFVLVAWTLSLALTLLLWMRGHMLRNLGPAAERRAIELATATPVIFGIAVVSVLAVRSAFGVDHCQVHGHHVHLCLMHGAPWLEERWAVALLVFVAAVSIIRFTILVHTVIRRHGLVSRLRRACRHEHGIWWADTAHAFCFVSGFRDPQIFISTATWSVLDDNERAAMLAHERSHVEQRDVARRFVLDILWLLGAPLAWLLRRGWDSATERLCDARAAAVIGSGDAVASAMVKVCRLGVGATLSSASFTPPSGVLTERVEAALAEQAPGDAAAHVIVALVSAVVLVTLMAVALHAEPLHHLLESLLG